MNSIAFMHVEFQVQMFIPHLLNGHEIEIESQRDLVDTQHGRPLYSKNVLNTLARWAKAIDTELHLTTMDIRSLYCTIVICRHVHRREICDNNDEFVFQDLSEREFKEILACVMNTSTEQIKLVHAAGSHTDYTTPAARVISIWKSSSDVSEI